MGFMYAFLSALSFAFSNIMLKKGYKAGSTDNGFFITVFVNVIVLGIVFFITQLLSGFHFEFSLAAFLFFVLAGMLTTGLGRLTLIMSIGKIGPSRGSAIKNVSPLFTVLFGIFILSESFTIGAIFGMAVLLGAILLQGIAVIKMQKNQSREIAASLEENDYRQQKLGYFLALLASFCFGIGLGVRKQGLLIWDDAFFGALVGAMTSLFFFILYDAIRGQLISTIKRNFSSFNRYYFLAGLFTSTGPLFFFLSASYISVSYVSVLAGTEPVLTAFLSILLLKEERLTLTVWISISMVAIGTAIILIF
jgi:drug/metabolite transporter (DMT)-like permease